MISLLYDALIVHSTRPRTVGDRAFPAAASRMPEVTSSTALLTFKSKLKT